MLFSAWIIDLQVCWGLNFGDWSLKFKNPKKKFYNKFYDARWAFYIMHRNRNHKPDIDSKSPFLFRLLNAYSRVPNSSLVPNNSPGSDGTIFLEIIVKYGLRYVLSSKISLTNVENK